MLSADAWRQRFEAFVSRKIEQANATTLAPFVTEIDDPAADYAESATNGPHACLMVRFTCPPRVVIAARRVRWYSCSPPMATRVLPIQPL